ncbi:hypothetical protein IFM89_008485, partial [Coptis chinensis]
MHFSSSLKQSLLFLLSWTITVCSADFLSNVDILFGKDHMNFSTDGTEVDLSLDTYTGSGFRSKSSFIYGKFEMQIKLVPGKSSGTVTTFYLNSTGEGLHDEVDFEFLGNVDGRKYILQTNIFIQNVGAREQKFRLGFDPTMDYHNYSIVWNPQGLIFLLDGSPIRYYKGSGLRQAMSLDATLWDGSDWATSGGKIKVDWTQAPFVASYRNYNVDACWYSGDGNGSNTTTTCSSSSDSWMFRKLTLQEQKHLAT